MLGSTLKQRFKTQLFQPNAIDIWSWIILRSEGRGCPVHCKIFSSSPGFYPLNASSILPSGDDNRRYLHALQMAPGWGTDSNITPGGEPLVKIRSMAEVESHI